MGESWVSYHRRDGRSLTSVTEEQQGRGMDWLEIVKVVQLITLFQNWDAFKGTVEAAEGCLEFYAFLLHIGGL